MCTEKAYLFDLNKKYDVFKKQNVYQKPNFIKKFETCPNTKGTGCLLSYKNRNVVILRGISEKTVQVYDTEKEIVLMFDVGIVPAYLSGNIHGEIFAFTDESGTEIKLHKITDGTHFRTFFRGAKASEITSIAFDKYCLRMAVASTTDTVHVFSLPKELALCGKSEEELKQSIQTDESENCNSKSIPEALLESRINEKRGFFGAFIQGSSHEKSYLKAYIDSSEKQVAIHGNKLLILTKEGELFSMDVQLEGHVYPTGTHLLNNFVLVDKTESAAAKLLV
jgi:hypothetical protein